MTAMETTTRKTTTATTTTLLKHEWLHTRGQLATLLGLIALIGVVGGLLGASGWPLLSELGLFGAVIAAALAVPAVQLTLTADYWRSGYGRTGYFTHSIPVRGSRIFWAKLAWVMLASLAAIVLTLALTLLAWWAIAQRSAGPAASWSMVTEAWSTVTAAAPAWIIAAGIVVLLASVLVWPVYYFFSVSVGHERRWAGLGAGGPVVVFVMVYLATQVLALLAMIVLPVGVGRTGGEMLGLVRFDMISELTAGAAASNDVMPIGFVASLVALAGFCLWRTARSWNRNVALG